MDRKIFFSLIGGIVISVEMFFVILCIVKLKDQPKTRNEVISRIMISMFTVAFLVAYVWITS
ncbi:hypothetical protein [Butyrivibrio sp. LB2008]|uniref:hypothetical protein n=1 Tax=Butyrivibrio sp. LB2008 TaxID=1408305 RepID=UPI00047C66A1|nr:hypothetical protein [Butyrivibrio sp. LB2008]